MDTLTLANYRTFRQAGRPAFEALMLAKTDSSRGRSSYVWQSCPKLTHGDVLRKRTMGEKRTFVVALPRDDTGDAPWEREEGHGPVTEWTTRAKRPGEWVLNSDRQSSRFYDAKEALEIATRDGWGLSPDKLHSLQAKLGRPPTRKEVTAEAVRLDYQHLSGWCNDEWQYIGVVLFELPHDEKINPERLADSEPYHLNNQALWGIESNSEDYIQEVALELLAEI